VPTLSAYFEWYHAAVPRHVITAPDDPPTMTCPSGPMVYLAGPIQGSANWQMEAIQILDDLAPELHVASPRAKDFKGGAERFLAWEQQALVRAAADGVVLFWLAKETKHHCSRPYAANARFELGELAVKAATGLLCVVVGIEQGFPGGKYLQRRLTLSYPQIPICRTLRQTCAVAAERACVDTLSAALPRSLAELFVVPSFGRNNG